MPRVIIQIVSLSVIMQKRPDERFIKSSQQHEQSFTLQLETTVVLFGPSGHGKSSTGNTLLGRQEFKKQIDVSTGRCRSTSQIEKAMCCRTIGRRYFELEIVDTPGLFQSNNVAETALKLLQVTDLKPHVFVLVLRSYKLTNDEQHTTDILRLVFGDRVFERTIIIVTHADEFESEHELVDLMKMFDDGKMLLDLCGNRIMLIDNVKKRFDFDKFRVFIDGISQCGRFVYDLDYSLTLKSILHHCLDGLADNTIAIQLHEINTELGRRLPHGELSVSVNETRYHGAQPMSLRSNISFKQKLDYKIVLVGKTGNGKSATGNTLLGWENFKSNMSAKGVTNDVYSARYTTTIGDSLLVAEIIDTSGLFDCGKVAETALKLPDVVYLRPNVFVFVFKAGHFTEEEKYTVDMFRIIFGEKVFRHTLIVITHGSESQDEEDFAMFLSNSEHVNKLTELCGKRGMKIENRTKDFDVEKFYRLIFQITQNGKLIYVNKHAKYHKDVLQKYLHRQNGDKSIPVQLQEMSVELGRQLSNWKVPLIAGAVVGAAMTGGGVLMLGALGSATTAAAAAAGSGVLASSVGSAAAYAGNMVAAGGAVAIQGAAVVGAGVLTLGRTLGPLLLRKFW